MSETCCKSLPLSEKVKESSQLNKESKKLYAEVAKIYDKNKSCICDIVKKEKIIKDRYSIIKCFWKERPHSHIFSMLL